MAPSKRSTPAKSANAATSTIQANINDIDSTTPSLATTTRTTTTSSTPKVDADAFAYSTIIKDIWTSYLRSTPQSLKIIDLFMAFLVFSGVVQFTYCVLVGNYPFNAFLSGFIATVGQFVLAAGLRSQCNIANVAEFPKITPERAFADFLFSSVVLHFAVVNFLG